MEAEPPKQKTTPKISEFNIKKSKDLTVDQFLENYGLSKETRSKVYEDYSMSPDLTGLSIEILINIGDTYIDI